MNHLEGVCSKVKASRDFGELDFGATDDYRIAEARREWLTAEGYRWEELGTIRQLYGIGLLTRRELAASERLQEAKAMGRRAIELEREEQSGEMREMLRYMWGLVEGLRPGTRADIVREMS